MRHGPSQVWDLLWYSVLEEALHQEVVIIRIVFFPISRVCPVGIEIRTFHVHFGVKILARQVLLGHFVHVAEASEAVGPGQLSVVVEEQPTLNAFAVLEFPRADRAALDAIFLVANHLQGGTSCMGGLEASLEQTACARIGVVLVELDMISFFLLPLLVQLDGLARGK